MGIWRTRISELKKDNPNLIWPKILSIHNDQYQDTNLQHVGMWNLNQEIGNNYPIIEDNITYNLLGVYYGDGYHYCFRYITPTNSNNIDSPRTKDNYDVFEYDGLVNGGIKTKIILGNRGVLLPYGKQSQYSYYVACSLLLLRNN